MKKYKITKFTEEEKQDILELYSEWMKPENAGWVHIEYDKVVSSAVAMFGAKITAKIEEKVGSCKWIKNIAEKVWVYEKFKDHQMHSSPYINRRIGEFPIRDFNDETQQRIILEEIEKGFLSDFIKNRIKKMSFKSLGEELSNRQTLKECEKRDTKFIRDRIFKYTDDYKFEIDSLDDELKTRIILEGFEYEIREGGDDKKGWDSKFIKQRFNEYNFNSIEEEFITRQRLYDCERHSSDFIEKEILRLKNKGEIKSIDEELHQRFWFESYEKDLENKVEPVYDDGEMFEKESLAELNEINWFKKKLNEVGKGFCLAKWNQVSILLQTGMTHSCHHPTPHKIPLSELEANPTALHNTNFKKEQRKTMLEGGRPEECDYCWNVEDSNEDSFSDRHFKSAEDWTYSDFDKIKNSDWKEDTNPPYVEISFSNKCNMRCMYCDVKSSSRWQSEIKSLGSYPTSGMFNNTDWLENEDMMPINYGDHNPYTEAFMNWWPDLYKDLHTFRITGGEPLLHGETFYILDYIIEHHEENPNLVMSINSNCSVPEEVFDKFIEKVKIITDNNMVKNFGLYTSIEADDEQAEYIRDGLNVDRFWKHINKFLSECEKPDITIMATYNILSIPTYHKVIEKVFELKQKYYNGKRYRKYAILLDTSYLRYPEFQQAKLISTGWVDTIKKDYQLMLEHSDEKYVHITGHGHTGFYEVEIEKLRRLIDWISEPIEDITWLLKQRQDLAKMLDEYDLRRDKKFLKVFPEYKDFYNICKKYI